MALAASSAPSSAMAVRARIRRGGTPTATPTATSPLAPWLLLPRVTPSSPSSGVSAFAGLVAAGGPVLVLRHSHDPDTGFVLLLFATDAALPITAVKVAGGERTATAIFREARHLELVH